MQMMTGSSVSQNVVIAMAGIAKVYVGEIVETGKFWQEVVHLSVIKVKYHWKDKGFPSSHTRYQALGPDLIPVYRQSPCRWL